MDLQICKTFFEDIFYIFELNLAIITNFNKMKLLTSILTSLSFLILLSCNKKETPKVKYESAKNLEKVIVKKDTSQIEIADLPIQMEGTNYILHPIGKVRLSEDYKQSNSKNLNVSSYVISNYNRFELTGYFDNIKFQHLDSTATHLLTDKQIQIQTATFLNTTEVKIGKKYLVYTLADMDSNKDGDLDENDIKSLYLSFSNGQNFIKLSIDFQEVIDWNLLKSKNRLYFRSIEDINKNGAFDKTDKLHYFFVDLNSKGLKAEEYFL